jgi:hypothetical protein
VPVSTSVSFRPTTSCDPGALWGTLVFSLRNNDTKAVGFGCYLCPGEDGAARFEFTATLDAARDPGPYHMDFNYDALAGEASDPGDLLFAGSGDDRIPYQPACGQPCTAPPGLPVCNDAVPPVTAPPTSAVSAPPPGPPTR